MDEPSQAQCPSTSSGPSHGSLSDWSAHTLRDRRTVAMALDHMALWQRGPLGLRPRGIFLVTSQDVPLATWPSFLSLFACYLDLSCLFGTLMGPIW